MWAKPRTRIASSRSLNLRGLAHKVNWTAEHSLGDHFSCVGFGDAFDVSEKHLVEMILKCKKSLDTSVSAKCFNLVAAIIAVLIQVANEMKYFEKAKA